MSDTCADRRDRAENLRSAMRHLKRAAEELKTAAALAPHDCGHVPQETHLAGGVKHIGRQIVEILNKNNMEADDENQT